jgi:hypothetical protein
MPLEMLPGTVTIGLKRHSRMQEGISQSRTNWMTILRWYDASQ